MKTIVIDGVKYNLTPAEEENEIIQKKKILQEKNYRVDSSDWKVSPFDNSIKISPCGMASEIVEGQFKGEQHFSCYYLIANDLFDKVPTEKQLQQAFENGELEGVFFTGFRNYSTGAMYDIGSNANLWSSSSSSSSGLYSSYLDINASFAMVYNSYKTYGFSVRLLAD